MKLNFIVISIIVLLGFVVASQAGTYKPFVRSRYSLRWRKTTETPKVWHSSTIADVDKKDIEKTTKKTISLAILPEITTLETKLKTSTHMPDYDYYGNNDVEDTDHKHLVNN